MKNRKLYYISRERRSGQEVVALSASHIMEKNVVLLKYSRAVPEFSKEPKYNIQKLYAAQDSNIQ